MTAVWQTSALAIWQAAAMLRSCFLVIDHQGAGSLCTRKLVIETARFNVITAYSGHEAIETLRKFPNLDGVVMDAGMEDIHAADLARALKQIRPALPIIAIGAPAAADCDVADFQLEGFDPVRIIPLLKKLSPDRAETVSQRAMQLQQDEPA